MRPTIGAIVHFVSYGSPGGEHPSECRAAIVTGLPNGLLAPAGSRWCNLAVLNPTGLFFNLAAQNEDEQVGGTWHYPCNIE